MPEQFIHGYALLVGVGTTADPKLSLPVTVKDARAIKAILNDPRHCAYPDDAKHVRLLHDEGASRSAILDGLDWLAERAVTDPEATVVIYYSGHGMLDSANDAYYLIPHEFNRQAVEQTALSAETLGSRLSVIAAKRLWVIIDSCHAEGMATAKDSLPSAFLPTALPKGAVDSLKQGEGRAIFTSSRGQQSSWVRPDGTLSLYTYHLIEALKGAANQVGDRQVTISNVMTHLGKTVAASAQTLCQAEQTPFLNAATEDFAVALLGGGKGLPFSDQKLESPAMLTNQEVVTPALAMARRSLAILEEQAAAYGKLQMPAHLRIDLEEKRQEVAGLEARLRDGKLDGMITLL